MIKRLIRSHPGLRQIVRNTKMIFVRLRYGLKNVHPTFYMVTPCSISPDLEAGPYSFLNKGCLIEGRVKIGKYCMFAPEASIIGSYHVTNIPGLPIIFSGRPEIKKTIVDDDVWVGYRAIILAGVHIGRGAIVAAGAVVTHDIEPYTIVGGIPAKPIGKRFDDPDKIKMHDEMLRGPARLLVYPERLEQVMNVHQKKGL
jgi:acetyltransferase-like isoleucine patch superfamily enzyme